MNATETPRTVLASVALQVGIRMLCDADLRLRRGDVAHTAERTSLAELVAAGETIAWFGRQPAPLGRAIRERL